MIMYNHIGIEESRPWSWMFLVLLLTTLFESAICETERQLLEINGNHHHTINDFGLLFVDDSATKPTPTPAATKRSNPKHATILSTPPPDDIVSTPPDASTPPADDVLSMPPDATQAPTQPILRDRKKTAKKVPKSSTMAPSDIQTSLPDTVTLPPVKTTKAPKGTAPPTPFPTPHYDYSGYPIGFDTILPTHSTTSYPKSGKKKGSYDNTQYPSETMYPSETLSPTDYETTSKKKNDKSIKYDRKKTRSPTTASKGKGKGSSKGSSKDNLKINKSSKGTKPSKKKKGEPTFAPTMFTNLPLTMIPTASLDDTFSPSMTPSPSGNSTTLAPSSTASQTDSPSAPPVTTTLDVRLTDYALLYTFDQTRIPQTDEVDGVVNLTQSYLDSFFEPRFDDTYRGITTDLVTSRFLLNQPFELNLTSTAMFSSDPPTVSMLDIILTEAFTGSNLQTYLSLVGRLPTSNIFSTTTEIFFEIEPRLSDTTTKSNAGPDRKTSGAAIGTSAAAGTLTAFLIAFLVTKRSKKNKVLSGKAAHAGHVTVADDTYRGDSTIFSGTSTMEYRRQTRFAENTRFGDDVEEYHSLAGRSEWALSTLAISEVDSEEEDDSTEDGHLRHQLFDEEEAAYASPLTRVEAPSRASEDVLATPRDDPITLYRDASDDDDISEDEDVPMRVVDLIKRFSPTTFR